MHVIWSRCVYAMGSICVYVIGSMYVCYRVKVLAVVVFAMASFLLVGLSCNVSLNLIGWFLCLS